MTASLLSLPVTPEARAAACRVAAEQSASDIEVGILRERDRVLDLLRIAKQAERLGVAVNVAATISDGADPADLRAIVLRLATEKDQVDD